jgi:hypothetical protein
LKKRPSGSGRVIGAIGGIGKRGNRKRVERNVTEKKIAKGLKNYSQKVK